MNNENVDTTLDFFKEDKSEKNLLKLNLQFFAEGEEDPPADPPEDPPEDDPEDPPEDKTFSQSEVDAAVARAVDKALKKKQKDFEEEKEQAIKDAKKKASDYAKMTQKEKEDAEYKERVDALEKRERELNLKQLRTEVESDLKEEGLPTEFAESLVSLDDNEKIKESITSIKKTFDDAVNAAVKEKLRQDSPEVGNTRVKTSNLNKTKAEMAKKNRIIK